MADNPAIDERTGRRRNSVASTAWTMVVGWALVRILIGRADRSGRAASTAQGGPSPTNRDAAGRPDAGKEHASPDAVRERGRGRHADTPTDIPAKGWKDVLWRTYEQIGKDRVLAVAAGVTFYALLALFPAIGALVSIYGLFSDPSSIQQHVEALGGVMPDGATEIIGEQIARISSQGGGALSFGFIFGLAISLWSANAGMKAIFDALNIVYDEEEKRSFIKLNLQSLAFTLGAILFLIAAITGIVVLPILLDYVGQGESAEWLIRIGRWPVLLVVVVFGLALLYRFGPSRDKPEWKWVTPGGIVAAVLWLAGSMVFSWYVANFGSYNETYGSLGAVIGFMTWIWLSTIIVLVGAEINAEMEHQTAHDTTEGAHEPMGVRGATMADTIGEAQA